MAIMFHLPKTKSMLLEETRAGPLTIHSKVSSSDPQKGLLFFLLLLPGTLSPSATLLSGKRSYLFKVGSPKKKNAVLLLSPDPKGVACEAEATPPGPGRDAVVPGPVVGFQAHLSGRGLWREKARSPFGLRYLLFICFVYLCCFI